MAKVGSRSSVRGHMLPFFGLGASFLMIALLFGGARLLPIDLLPGSAAPQIAAEAGSVIYLPAGAHAAGANGANWRTDVEFHNPGSTTTTFTVQLLRRDANNASPTAKAYFLDAKKSRRFADMLLTEFDVSSGAAALRIVVGSGSLLVTSRTYNLIGPNPWALPQGASFGQFVPGLDQTAAIGYGQEGRLVHLTQRPAGDLDGFRTNIGIVNASPGPIDVRIDFYRADGTWLGKKDGSETNLPPYGFRQLDQAFSAWGTLPDAYAIVKPTSPGAALFAFATLIDNHVSGDPVFIPAVRRTASGPSPTPTPTTAPMPSPTPSGGKPNLILFKPSAWPACIVANYQTGCCGSFNGCCSPSFLSSYYRTFVQWIVANDGQVTLTGPVRFSFAVDGTVVMYLNWENPNGLEPGYGKILEYEHTDPIAAGTHSLTIAADPQQTIAETNEGDNACSASGNWTSIVFATQKAEMAGAPPEITLTSTSPQRLTAQGVAPLSTAGTVYVPASAHASGMNGASWRTDVEVHNPGTTAVIFTVELLKQGNDNGSGVASKSFSLGPQQSVRYVDVLSQLFQFDGAAALRFVPTAGATIVVNSRTYNLIGPNSVGLPVGASFSQFVPGLDESVDPISYGEEGRIIQLNQCDASSHVDFRTNIGYVNTTSSPIDLRIDLYGASGALLGTIQDGRTHLRAYEFLQINGAFGEFTSSLDDGYAVIRTTTPGGRFLAFATVIDNHLTGDPVFIPATRLAGTTPPPTPTPTPTPGTGVITGPGGSTVTLPPGAGTDGSAITLVVGNGSTLPASGETLVSTVVKANVTGGGVAVGNGSFTVAFPVSGTVSDPDKLLLKVATSTGHVYPVAGVWSASAKTFTAELMRVWDGWTMGVVTSPGTTVTSLAPATGVSSLGWATPTDWQTCTFRVFNNAPAAPASFATGIANAMKKACEHLRGAEFRSPRLWVDNRWNPKARALHLVQGRGPNDPSTSFSQAGNQDDASFSLAAFNDEQMQSLGQVYFNWDDWPTVIQPRGWSYENVTIHELLHAVQAGYDYRDKWEKSGDKWLHPAMGINEGTATLVGQTFQSNLNGIYGGDVTVRSPEQPASLSQEVLWNCCGAAYSRQDFFAYVAKRWNGGSLRDLRWLYQSLSDQTEGQFGKSATEYDTLYRKAMDFHYRSSLNLPLPDLYTEYALDRAYGHGEPALLRAADRTLRKNSLDVTLFVSVKTWDPVTAPGLELAGIAPLSSRAVKVTVPDSARTAKSFTTKVAVAGAALGRQGVRVFVYPEKDGVLEAGLALEVGDTGKPVVVPVSSGTSTMTILVVNGSVTNSVATATLSTGSPLTVFPDPGPEPYSISGSPGVDWTLRAGSEAWPASYRLVWNFGDGTPEVAVENAPTVTHRWADAGVFQVTARLYVLPAGSFVAGGDMPARIAYFEGDFRLSEFRGSSSGTIYFTGLLARMALDPTNTYFEYSNYVYGSEGERSSAYLYLDPPPPGGSRDLYKLGDSVPSITPVDCVPSMTISGNTLTMKYSSSAISSTGFAVECVTSQLSQSGSQIQGTVSFWEHHYDEKNVLRLTGSGSYTLRGTYFK